MMPILSKLAMLLSLPFSGPGVPPSAEGLTGRRPATARSLTEFSALNTRGEPRGPADLLGEPTVLWFYPMAGTPG